MKAISKCEIDLLVARYEGATIHQIEHPLYNRKIAIKILGRTDIDSRPRFVAGRAINVKKIQVNKYFRRMVAKDPVLMSVFITTPMLLEVTSKLAIPKSGVNKEEKLLMKQGIIEPMNTSDVDNLAKLWMDCLEESYVYLNDKAICSLSSNKVFADEDEVGVYINLYYNTEYKYEYHKALISRSKVFRQYLTDDFWNHKHVNMFTLRTYIDLFRFHFPRFKTKDLNLKHMREMVSRLTDTNKSKLMQYYKCNSNDITRRLIDDITEEV